MQKPIMKFKIWAEFLKDAFKDRKKSLFDLLED